MGRNAQIGWAQPRSHSCLVMSAIRRSLINKAFSQLSSQEEDQNRMHVKSIHSIKIFLT